MWGFKSLLVHYSCLEIVDVRASEHSAPFEHGQHADAHLVRTIHDAIGSQVRLAYLGASELWNDPAEKRRFARVLNTVDEPSDPAFRSRTVIKSDTREDLAQVCFPRVSTTLLPRDGPELRLERLLQVLCGQHPAGVRVCKTFFYRRNEALVLSKQSELLGVDEDGRRLPVLNDDYRFAGVVDALNDLCRALRELGRRNGCLFCQGLGSERLLLGASTFCSVDSPSITAKKR